MNNILDYLSLDRKKVSTHHKKVNTVLLDDLITNFDQFEKGLKEVGLEKYLD